MGDSMTPTTRPTTSEAAVERALIVRLVAS
jgi:hypothetical protein